jgi:hypothetical protein
MTELAKYRLTRCVPIMHIIFAGRQTSRIWVLLEYPSNQCLYIRRRLGPESQESLVNGLTHHVGQPDPALAKRPRLTETLGIKTHVDQTRIHLLPSL